MHTLYICYFGLREPLVQTQVLPYLRQLVAAGIQVSLMTFEPQMQERWDSKSISAMRSRLGDDGISWHLLAYHKRPSLPATLYDIWAGARFASWLAREEGIDVFHARAHIAAAMGALAKWWLGGGKVKLLFDIRGFVPEEYADAGVWPKSGWLFRGVKAVERKLLSASDAFVVLTEKAKDILFPNCLKEDQAGRPIEVIPCCVDWQRFQRMEAFDRMEIRHHLHLEDRHVMAYVGSFGGWYLTEELLSFAAYAHRRNPSEFTMILTQRDVQQVRARLLEKGIREEDCLVAQVEPTEVPRYLKAADIALSFIKCCYSKQASSPTKIAEYLASGLPVISNTGIGDLDKMFLDDRVGVILNDFNEQEYDRALKEIATLCEDSELTDRCRRIAREQFDLQGVGGVRYRRLYEKLLGKPLIMSDKPQDEKRLSLAAGK